MFKFCTGIPTFKQIMAHKMDLQDFSTLFHNRKHLLFNLLLNMPVGKFLTFNTQLTNVGDIYPKSCKVYHRGHDCVSYNQHPSRWKLRRGGVNEVPFGYSRDFPFQLTNITVVVRTRRYFSIYSISRKTVNTEYTYYSWCMTSTDIVKWRKTNDYEKRWG